ncbi:hypothetical protein PLACP1_25030 [Planifilum fimeticola]
MSTAATFFREKRVNQLKTGFLLVAKIVYPVSTISMKGVGMCFGAVSSRAFAASLKLRLTHPIHPGRDSGKPTGSRLFLPPERK